MILDGTDENGNSYNYINNFGKADSLCSDIINLDSYQINDKLYLSFYWNYNINGEAFDVGETFSGVNFAKGLEAVEKLKDLLPDNFSLTDLALKWILMHDEVSVVIPGAINKSQVQMNVHASDLEDISSKIVLFTT